MTAASSSQQRYKRGRTGSMHLVNGSVSIRFSAPENSAQGSQLAKDTTYVQHKCTAYLGSQQKPVPRFSVKLHGQVQSPELEVVLQKALLKKLPLLKDVERSTSSSKPSDIHLPCTFWALVSVLILLEGHVTVKEWFEGSPSGGATLPGDTLAVADFMDCADISRQIVSWLQDQLSTVVKYCSKDTTSTTHAPQPANICFLTQVLRHVSSEQAKDLFLTAEGNPRLDVGAAISMPQYMLRMWVASAAPKLDFQASPLTPAQWSRLAVCIAQLPPGDVSSLQVFAKPCTAFSSNNSSFSQDLSINFKHMLGALEGAVSPMSHLQHLGLHNLRLSPVMIPALEQLLSNLPTTVTKLTMSTSTLHPSSAPKFTSIHKLMIFRAVARVTGLLELHMKDWEQFVGADAGISTEPLQSMPGLTIFVPVVRTSEACKVTGLSFVAAGGAGTAIVL